MDADDKQTVEVAALGRPFSLGMLYDCRKDSLIPGITLWDLNGLKNDIQERPQCYNNFEIVASESIADKSSALNVKASLKASFLGGLVEVGGSAKYLNDSKTSKNQARVTLNYQATTKMQQLSMNQLGKVKHQNVFDKGIATHVVTAILYGAQAFFVFDCEVSDEESHQDIQGNMKVMIKNVPSLAVEGEGSLKMDKKDIEKVEKFSCKFHGDFLLKKSPTTFQDAVEVYQSLPQLLGTNGENAVPVKVWLLPLVNLDSSAAKLVRQISSGLVQKCQSVLEDFTELEMRCNDAIRTATAQKFPQIGDKLKTFKEVFSEYKLEFQQNLAKILPSIRGGGEEEAVLAEILKKRHSSPFNNTSLNEWMGCKEREIYTLQSFIDNMENTQIVPSQSHLYKETLSAEHAVCLVFTSLGSAEPYLSALSNYLEEKPKPDDPQDPRCHDIEKEQWYASKEVSDAMRIKAKLFSDFAEANKENKNIKFLTVGLANETQKGSSIYVYKDGFTVSENFEPPSKPETVTAGDVTHNSVTLKISPPRFGAENITSYCVEYYSVEDGWKQTTAAKAEEVTVSGLTPNTEYMFRCRAVTSVGVGLAGEVSGHIKTFPCSPPGKPQVETNSGDVTHNSVRLKISPPRFGAENITSYCVEYCVSGEDGWKQTPAAKAEEVTVSGLTPNTEYMFRCRAVTSVGVGLAGEVSGHIKTLPCSPPGKPQVETNSSEMTVSWEKPAEIGRDVHILSYIVEYAQTEKEVKEEDLQWNQTVSRVGKGIISGLQSETEYAVRVRCDCGLAGRSKESITVNNIKTKSLTMTKEVLKERKRLENSVENLQKQVKVGLAKLEEIKETSDKLKEHEAVTSRNENFELEVTVTKPVQVDISGTGNYITNCQRCHYTCHYPCPIANDADKRRCTAMGPDGYCTQCPGKCYWNVHFNQKCRWEYKEVTEEQTVKELQEKYLKASEAKISVKDIIKELKAEYKRVQEEVEKLMEASAKCQNRLKEIALRPNPLSTPEYIDMLIEGEKSEGRPGWKKRVEVLMNMREREELMAQPERGERLLKKIVK